MIEQMDAAILAIQAAAGARHLYGPEHAAPKRQVALAVELLGAIFPSRRSLRLVRLDNTLLFEDLALPSCARFNDLLIPLLASHGVEWIEFQRGLARPELTEFLMQLERPDPQGPLGTPNVRVGSIGRNETTPTGTTNVISALDPQQQIPGFKKVWEQLRTGGAARPDQRLAELVESIRLAVAVGADVCKQLADVKHHDEYTFVHTVNVAILSAALGEAVGMRPNQVFDLTLAALLHDVGKQHTPLEILNKPGRLDESERKRMERHTIDGAAILLERPGVPDFAPIVAFEHHANLDGTGYPRLPTNQRPHLASQIVHISDIFDALRTNRPYRAAMDAAKVRSMLLEISGKAFDTSLVNLFLKRIVKVPASTPQNNPAPKAA